MSNGKDKLSMHPQVSLILILSVALAATTSRALTGPSHGEVTRSGLKHVDPSLVTQISDSNKDQDSDIGTNTSELTERHAVACRFTAMRDWYTDAIRTGLDKLDRDNPDHRGAARTFGAYLHGVQDFYSHSNWIYMGKREIFDSGLSDWPVLTPYTRMPGRDYAIVEGEVPADVQLVQPTERKSGTRYVKIGDQNVAVRYTDVPFPTGYVPQVTLKGETSAVPGLMTANAKDSRANASNMHEYYRCPPVGVRPCGYDLNTPAGRSALASGEARFGEKMVCQNHGSGSPEPGWAMNLDRTDWGFTSGAGREAARDLAAKQTTHEWCRWLHLAKARRAPGTVDRYVVTGRLIGVWGTDTHMPKEGLCSAETPGPHRVEVSADNFTRVAGQVRKVVVFKGDFRAVKASQRVGGDSRYFAPKSVCVNVGDDIVAGAFAYRSSPGQPPVEHGGFTRHITLSPQHLATPTAEIYLADGSASNGRVRANFLFKVFRNGCTIS